jgi:hypothetical protein
MGSRSVGELWKICITLDFSSEELKLTFVVVWERQGGGRDSKFSGHKRGRRYSFCGVAKPRDKSLCPSACCCCDYLILVLVCPPLPQAIY